MNKMKNIFYGIFVLSVLFVTSCSREDFADINSNPSVLEEPDLRFSITKSIEQMYSNDYTVWFYNNFDYVYPWSQVATANPNGGNSEAFVEMGPAGGQSIYGGIIPNTLDIRDRIDKMEDEDKAVRQAMSAMTFPIQIQTAITMTDNTGSMVYTEAGLAPYTSPPNITPVYDNQELLFNTWLSELDGAIAGLMADGQLDLGDQDLIYQGDYVKWAKFCNLLKLKIAARLVNKDRARALAIAEEVATSPAGYMDDLSDDFIYNRGSLYRGTGNGNQPGMGAKNLIDFMIENKDPRIGVLFEKNHFNGEVVQAFIDAGKDLPPYVEQYVVLDGNGDFQGWSGPGEPWVRFHGVPLSPDAVFEADNDIYFNQGELNKISLNGAEKTYRSTSRFEERVTRTGYAYTYPTKPGGRLLELRDNYPPLSVILGSSAETNLYLAEFKLLGAALPNSAQDYFNRGVELSVLRLDNMAASHRFPYYDSDPVYEDDAMAAAGSTKLKAGQIEDLLAQPAYDLSSDGLEKVYIQQYINFAASPADLWATTRRSGIPKTNSTVLPRDQFLAGGSELTVPRRFEIGTPTEESKNYQNEIDAINEQGFTTGTNDPMILNSERIWFDIGNPNYGQGPSN